MIWWLKARQAHFVLPAGIAGLAVLTLVFHDVSARLPSISLSNGTETQVLLFAPVVVVAAVARCLDSRLPAAESSGIRRVRLLDTALIVAFVLAAILVGCAVGALFSSAAAWTSGRNTAFLTGLMLCARALVGRPAVMVPLGWVMTVVLVGFRTWDAPYFWAIVPEPFAAPHAAIATVLVFAAGVVAQLRTTRSEL
ncbi:hypothetical protein J7E96_06865 [Streptomyces sp. ISL-96]|uniref:hypothetical protein n=1 Tax=Streptomyces sp. ISL-96 TaxID=2819191 RepID=UPI001BE64B3D|nr:hypothetical protein [Streptomyces sp. ISL-96]MBT2488247.1 hypothetical protein [Streptomyces sp. ISL-96]